MSDWRIDELAQRAGVAVDTIRYYQREGLLPSGERSGRTRRFGPEHLERLERIRALQSRRFSLAAIQALLERDDPGALAGAARRFGGGHLRPRRAARRPRASTPRSCATSPTPGCCATRPSTGASAYDADDVNVLRAFADLGRLAIPDHALVEVGRIYAEGLDEIQRRVVEVFTFVDSHCWDDEHAAALPHDVLGRGGALRRDVRVIADYTQQRNLQRAVLHKIEEHGADHTPATTSD